MKKIIKKFIMLCMIVFLTTGCLKYNVTMEVKSNKQVNLEMIYAFGVDASEYEESQKEQEETECGEDEFCSEEEEDMSMDVKKEDYEELLKYGYKVEEYEEKKDDMVYSGIKITKSFDSIDDITDEKNTVEFDFVKFLNDEDGYKIDPVIFSKNGDGFVAKIVFDYSSEDTSSEDMLNSEEYKEILETMDLKYTITLPQEAKSHNATKVSKDGKTLTWELEYGKKNEVNFEFSLGTNPMWYFIIIGGIVCAVALVGGIVVSMNNNKKYATMLDQQMKGIVPDDNVVPPMFDNQPVAQPQVMPQQPVEQPVQQPVMEQPMVQPMQPQQMQPQQMPQQQTAQPQMMPQQPIVDNQSFGAQNNNFPN